MWTNEIKKQNKTKSSRDIETDHHAFYDSIWSTSNVVVPLKDGLTVRRRSQKEYFLSIILGVQNIANPLPSYVR